MTFLPDTNKPQSDEVRFNSYGHEMRLGELVWTRKLYGSLTSGSYIREKYGQSPVIEKIPRGVTLRHAKQDWDCEDCGQKIYQDDMHGSTFYDHYCLDCVTPYEPKTEVEFKL